MATRETTPTVVSSHHLKTTVEVPASPPAPWYKSMGEAAGGIMALLAVLGYIAWVISRIINADRDIKELRHDLRNAETKITALDLKREDAARELAVLKTVTTNLETAMGDLKTMTQQVLNAVTNSRR